MGVLGGGVAARDKLRQRFRSEFFPSEGLSITVFPLRQLGKKVVTIARF